MARRTAVLFQTHFFDSGSARVFARLQRGLPSGFEALALVHLGLDAPVPAGLRKVPHHIVRTPELRYPPYTSKCGGADWNIWNGGHTDLIMLHFFRAHPEYDCYWMVEYDVRFSGNWRRFFDPLEAVDADFLSPVLRRRADQPGWAWWAGFAPAVPLRPEAQLCAFMPIYRVSQAGIRAVDAAWRAGWAGHSEAVWPSAIAAAGLRLVDPGGDGPFTPPDLRHRFYSSSMQDVGLAPGTLMFKPPLYRPGSRPDMLWHPVKPFWPRAELRQALRELRADLGRTRRDLLGRLTPRPVQGTGPHPP
jgi:hypothetical protein